MYNISCTGQYIDQHFQVIDYAITRYLKKERPENCHHKHHIVTTDSAQHQHHVITTDTAQHHIVTKDTAQHQHHVITTDTVRTTLLLWILHSITSLIQIAHSTTSLLRIQQLPFYYLCAGPRILPSYPVSPVAVEVSKRSHTSEYWWRGQRYTLMWTAAAAEASWRRSQGSACPVSQSPAEPQCKN